VTIIEQRIADRQVLILVERFLKAGILDGQWYQPTEEGVPQGSAVSPLLANLYLHQFDYPRKNETASKRLSQHSSRQICG
jgi:retron-type reverse transcriptase